MHHHAPAGPTDGITSISEEKEDESSEFSPPQSTSTLQHAAYPQPHTPTYHPHNQHSAQPYSQHSYHTPHSVDQSHAPASHTSSAVHHPPPASTPSASSSEDIYATLYAKYKPLPVSSLKEQIKSIASSSPTPSSLDDITAQLRSMVEKSDIIDLLIQLQMQSGRLMLQEAKHGEEREADTNLAGGGGSKLFTFASHDSSSAAPGHVTSPSVHPTSNPHASPASATDSPSATTSNRPLTSLDRFTVTSGSSSQLSGDQSPPLDSPSIGSRAGATAGSGKNYAGAAGDELKAFDPLFDERPSETSPLSGSGESTVR